MGFYKVKIAWQKVQKVAKAFQHFEFPKKYSEANEKCFMAQLFDVL